MTGGVKSGLIGAEDVVSEEEEEEDVEGTSLKADEGADVLSAGRKYDNPLRSSASVRGGGEWSGDAAAVVAEAAP